MTETRPNRREVIRLGLGLTVAFVAPDDASAALQETPVCRDDVADGKLPKVEQRVPEEPAVAELETIGTPGGEMQMLMGGLKDTRMMVGNGNVRLVG